MALLLPLLLLFVAVVVVGSNAVIDMGFVLVLEVFLLFFIVR